MVCGRKVWGWDYRVMLTSRLAWKNTSSLQHSVAVDQQYAHLCQLYFKSVKDVVLKCPIKVRQNHFLLDCVDPKPSSSQIYGLSTNSKGKKTNILNSWKMTESSRLFWYAREVNQSYSPQPCRHLWIGAISTHTAHAYGSQPQFAQYNHNHTFYWDDNKSLSAGTGLSAPSEFVALTSDLSKAKKTNLLIFNRSDW